jgi:hypothetical protein
VPAAAVIREVQALSGMIGRKASVGGLVSLMSNTRAQPWTGIGKPPDSSMAEVEGIPCGAVKCVDIRKNTSGESVRLGLY